MNKKQVLLLLSNIAALLILIGSWFLHILMARSFEEVLLLHLVILSAFTFLSLIVYYLSIIADALSKRTKELEEREKKINDKK